MIRSLFTGANGMTTQQLNMNVISNNLANVNTTGFKKSRAEFQDLFYQNYRSPGTVTQAGNEIPTGLQVGLGASPSAVSKIATQGDLINTGGDFDMAIEGKGYFQVTQADGTIAYTRNGSFKLNSQGQVVNAEGLLLEPAITVPITAKSVTITQDGVVSYTTQGTATPTQAGSITIASFVNPAGLENIGGNLLKETVSSGTPSVGTPATNDLGMIQHRFVEQSNVNIVDELVNMIVGQRAYEVNSKVVTASDEMIQTATNLKR